MGDDADSLEHRSIYPHFERVEVQIFLEIYGDEDGYDVIAKGPET